MSAFRSPEESAPGPRFAPFQFAKDLQLNTWRALAVHSSSQGPLGFVRFPISLCALLSEGAPSHVGPNNARGARMNPLGFWSALMIFVGSVAYAVAVAVGFASAGLTKPIIDPALAVMQMITMVIAPAFVMLMAALHVGLASERKAYSLAAFGFAIVLAGVTTCQHFVQLTVLRRLGSSSFVWPSPLYAVELLAWDLFLGLSLLFAAAVFRGDRLDRGIRLGMRLVGILCIVGLLGPATGDLRLQLIATFGYVVLFPFVALLLTIRFRRPGRQLDPSLNLELAVSSST
jgi:hypothetical protein